ncbi:MAG: hypothetical protein IPK15_11545 [Verrucomicrobia bacterium]|nr:hypothetical protein [Verrucomicrobiota bacterium]
MKSVKLSHLTSRIPGTLVLLTFLALSSGCERKSGDATTSTPAKKVELVPLTNMVAIKAGTFLRGSFP